jgi:hypothetical protein
MTSSVKYRGEGEGSGKAFDWFQWLKGFEKVLHITRRVTPLPLSHSALELSQSASFQTRAVEPSNGSQQVM